MIRKISVGVDPLKAMHYQLGSIVLNGTHNIQYIETTEGGWDVWIKNGANEVLKWKFVSDKMPVIVEYNLEF